MRSFPKLVALGIAFATAGVSWALQSAEQEVAQPKEQEPAQLESLLLIEPPVNARNEAPPSDARVAPQGSALNRLQTLPPPQRPESQSSARQPTRLARRQPFMRPAEPELADPNASQPPPGDSQLPPAVESMPLPETSGVVVQPTPPIVVDTDRKARRMYRDAGEVQLMMVVRNPADGCFYEIPLCIPACCTGEPVIDERRGLLGRGVVEYCWECGFRAKVIFRHVRGDVKVEYDG